jgi:hypothetical protein
MVGASRFGRPLPQGRCCQARAPRRNHEDPNMAPPGCNVVRLRMTEEVAEARTAALMADARLSSRAPRTYPSSSATKVGRSRNRSFPRPHAFARHSALGGLTSSIGRRQGWTAESRRPPKSVHPPTPESQSARRRSPLAGQRAGAPGLLPAHRPRAPSRPQRRHSGRVGHRPRLHRVLVYVTPFPGQ